MQAIILAAGTGTRLKPLTAKIPKCMLRIGRMTILERQISILNEYHVNPIKVVIGKEGTCWDKTIIEQIREIHNDLVINDDNLNTGPAYSCKLAMNSMEHEHTLIIDGDVVFEPTVIFELISHPSNVMIAKVSNDKRLAGMIKVNEQRVVEVGINKAFNRVYSGILKINTAGFKLLKQVLNVCNKKDTLLNPFNEILDRIEVEYIDSNSWINVNTLDLLRDATLLGGSHAKIDFRVHDSPVVKKEFFSEGQEKLLNQIRWLESIGNKEHFPRIFRKCISNNYVGYEIPFYNYPSLRDLLMSERLIDADASLRVIEKVMGFLTGDFHDIPVKNNRGNWNEKHHYKRFKYRIEETRVRSEIMNRILSYSKIKLNGEIYKNPSNIISTIKKKNDLFEPEYLYRCHGDLHFANILVSHDYDFMLVDPRGDLEPWDIAYDIGKLIHSCHGLYDFLHTDQFDLKMQKSTFWLDFKNKKSIAEYTKIYAELPKLLGKPKFQAVLGADFMLRGLFNEAMHFLTLMPFHLQHERRAIAMYVTGVKLINELERRICG